MIRRRLMPFMIFLVVMALASARADAIYYIPDITAGDPEPGTEHFYWLNNANSGNGLTLTADETFIVRFKLYAPNDWDSTYNGLRPSDNGIIASGASQNVVWSSGGGGGSGDGNFDSVYGYFYQIENTDITQNMGSFSFRFSPAAINGFGIVDDGSGLDPDSFSTFSYMGGDYFKVTFPGIGLTPAQNISEWFFVTSQYWWGWQPALGDGNIATGSTLLDSGGSYSPNGMIPAPNPEAPVVALYLVGLGGVVAVFRHRRKGSEAA